MPGTSGSGDEDGGQDERDGNDRAADLLHRSNGSLLGRHAFFDVVLHCLDHDDGVIDDKADGQHQSEQRERVDGEAERREDDERADERDRHGEQRDECRAPALQEYVDDQDHESKRDSQREDDLMYACVTAFVVSRGTADSISTGYLFWSSAIFL